MVAPNIARDYNRRINKIMGLLKENEESTIVVVELDAKSALKEEGVQYLEMSVGVE